MNSLNEICTKLHINPLKPSKDGLNKLMGFCHENISQDIIFEGSYRELFTRFLDYVRFYLEVFFIHKNTDDICAQIPEFNNQSTLEVIVTKGFNNALNNLSPKSNEINTLFGLMTPLHHAANFGYKKMVKDLVRLGARQDLENSKGEIPLHYSLSLPFLYSKELLDAKKEIFIFLSSERPDLISKSMEDGNTVIHLLALNGIVDLLVETVTNNLELMFIRNNFGILPVHTAVLNEQIDATEFLLKAATNPSDLLDFKKRTPLHYAAGVQNPDILNLCIHYVGQHIDIRDKSNQTPLMLAASYGNFSAVDKLLSAGANPRIADSNGQNTLQIAIYAQNIDVANRLLEIPGMESSLTHEDLKYFNKLNHAAH